MRPTKKFSNFLVTALAVLLIAGCGGAESRKAKYLERAKDYFSEENYDKARIELRNVLQIDPKHAEAHYLVGQVEEKRKNWRQAFTGYSKAVELDPGHVGAHLKLGFLHLLARNFDDASKMAEVVLAKEPDNHVALALKIMVMAGKGDVKAALQMAEELQAKNPTESEAIDLLAVFYINQKMPDIAIKVLEKGIASSPQNVSFRAALAGIHMDRKETDKAEQILQEIIRIQPDKLSHRLALSNFYSRFEQHDKAEKVLRDAIAANPADANRHLLLAEFLMIRKDPAQAEAVLHEAIRANPDKQGLRFGLAGLYERRNVLDKAETTYREIIKDGDKKQDILSAKTKLANLLIRQNRLDESGSLVTEVLEENSQDNEALFLKARLALAAGNAQEAITSLRTVQKDQPDSIEVLSLLASAHMMNKAPELAKESLHMAAERNPQSARARLSMAQFYVTTRDYDSALKWVDEALKVSPKDMEALQAKVEISAARKDLKGLQAAIMKMKEIYPDDPRGHYQLGQFYLSQNKYDAAIREFELALSKAGNEVLQPLSGIVKAHMAQGKPERAISRLTGLIKETPNHLFAHELLAQVYFSRKQYDEAEKSLREAIKANPKWNVPYRQLASLHMMRGNPALAEEVYRQGLEAIPDDAELLLFMAELHERAGDYKKAIAAYERALQKSPNLDIAANNLAALLADRLGDADSLAKAKSLAARFESSSQPAFRDTLGWVYYKSGDTDKAVTLLKDVVQQAPNVSVFRYHLGMAYYKQGNHSEAKTHLAKAVEGKSEYPGKDEARTVLQTIP